MTEIIDNVDFLVIDVSAMAIKHSALREGRLTTSDGRPSTHVIGCYKEVRSLVHSMSPQRVVFCYDRGFKWRRDLVPSYKENRRVPAGADLGADIDGALAMPGTIRLPPPPQEYPTPLFDVERMFRCFPGEHLAFPDMEGDDMVAHWVLQARERHGTTVIVSPDSDLLQLVDDDNGVVLFQKKKVPNRPRPISLWYDEDMVKDRMKLAPAYLSRWKALVGDPSDDIKGFPGAGRPGKKAALRTWVVTHEADEFFDHTKSTTAESVPDWLKGPLNNGRDLILRNHAIIDLASANARLNNKDPVVTQKDGDLGNALAVLVEFEAESILGQVAGLFRSMGG